jgi:hypothetical protein
VLRAGFRRFLVFLAVVLGGTAAVSVALGALSGSSISNSLATGYYVIGSVVLVGSFVLGVRGPLRSEALDENEAPPPPSALFRSRGRRRLRKATAEERHEGRRISLGLFALGVALLVLGAAIDPSRTAF